MYTTREIQDIKWFYWETHIDKLKEAKDIMVEICNIGKGVEINQEEFTKYSNKVLRKVWDYDKMLKDVHNHINDTKAFINRNRFN